MPSLRLKSIYSESGAFKAVKASPAYSNLSLWTGLSCLVKCLWEKLTSILSVSSKIRTPFEKPITKRSRQAHMAVIVALEPLPLDPLNMEVIAPKKLDRAPPAAGDLSAYS